MIPTKDYSIRSLKGGYDKNLSYLITCLQTGTQCLIDPAIPYASFQPFIRNNLSVIIITHTHGDHIAYLHEYITNNPNTTIVCHPDSLPKIKGGNGFAIDHRAHLTVGQLDLHFLHTPGHFPDSICIQLDHNLFTGDTLFVGRTGRAVNPESNIRELYNSVYHKILTLPDETVIYPGHDYGNKPSIRLDENIAISHLLKAQDENDFIQRMEQYEKTRSIGS